MTALPARFRATAIRPASGAVVSYASNYFNFTEVQRSYNSGGTTTIESYLYTYADPTVAYPL